jgi:hypothetical protein
VEPYHLHCLAQVRRIYETFFWNQTIPPALVELHTSCSDIRGHLRAIKSYVDGLKSLQEREEFARAISKLAGSLSTTLSEFERSVQSWLNPQSIHLGRSGRSSPSRHLHTMPDGVDFCSDLLAMLRFQSLILEILVAAMSRLVGPIYCLDLASPHSNP